MRILFVVFGARPHLYPLVPLAWACRAAGHEVRLASTPTLTRDAVDTGLSTVVVGGPPDVSPRAQRELAEAFFGQEPWPADWATNLAALDGRRLAHLRAVGRYLVAVAAAMVDDLAAFVEDWAPHVVVYDSFSYAGPVAAAVAGVPGVRHLSGPDSVQRLELLAPGREPLPEYANLFDRFGLPAVTAPASTVDPTPPSLRVATDTGVLSMRYIPYNGAGTEPDGLAGPRHRPRICVTWGHTIVESGGGAHGHPFRMAIDAIAAAGLQSLVVTTSDELDRLGPLPRMSQGMPSVPLHLVLPYCDAIVHQGGDGTVLTAATAALPQLAIAGSPEADLAGGRLAAAGVGIHLREVDLVRAVNGAALIRDTVGQLLDDEAYRDAADRLRDEIEAQPAPAEVVPAIAELAGVAPRGRKPG